MKQKLNLLVALTLILAIGFVGCQKEDADLGAAKVVQIKISAPSGPATYADEAAVADGTAVGFGSGHIYFTDNNGAILNYEAIASGDVAGLIGVGKQYTVSPAVTKAYIVGNTAAAGLPTTGNISAVEQFVIAIAAQSNVATVNLWGSGTLALIDELEGGDGLSMYECEIDPLKPTVARLEIAEISAKGNVTGFKVAGIFVDNYYPTAQVDGTITASLLFGDTNADYYVNGLGENEHADGTLYDWLTDAEATSNSLKPTNGAWAYQLFAAPAGSQVPRIIIRFSEVTVGGGTLYDQFVTVKGLRDGLDELTAIQQSNIYTIADIEFDESNLSPTPNLTEITVDVSVKLATWTVNAVTPIL